MVPMESHDANWGTGHCNDCIGEVWQIVERRKEKGSARDLENVRIE